MLTALHAGAVSIVLYASLAVQLSPAVSAEWLLLCMRWGALCSAWSAPVQVPAAHKATL